jgi:hypothetical protein
LLFCEHRFERCFFSIPVKESDRKYLRFTWKGTLYQFTCLAQGLSTCPRVYTKITSNSLKLSIKSPQNYCEQEQSDRTFFKVFVFAVSFLLFVLNNVFHWVFLSLMMNYSHWFLCLVRFHVQNTKQWTLVLCWRLLNDH